MSLFCLFLIAECPFTGLWQSHKECEKYMYTIETYIAVSHLLPHSFSGPVRDPTINEPT